MQSPLFWLVRSSHQQNFLPILVALYHRGPTNMHAMLLVRFRLLPIAIIDASRLQEKDIPVAYLSIVRHFVKAIGYLQRQVDLEWV